ncbi:zinc-dependent alcohol dehydrogenase family protein [Pseudomonas aeruginosa]|uniref:zinc-dependent alcohol dehydrogenase family protein n=1 Tax=Pseudomonas aeruginosa TaxID=287 RepID=UPI00053E7477|nr:NAD(P)-dependent alcohol dehydrogenase [Pseudomonas aeruginosa]EKV3034562.1 NAD(P)-dependent alcohol dehydrogenase [Pseudomonas aeruginosa]EKV3077002.1 NAD(P)-dependent alcohol dehydrogenase [Pseudomonas aeruginosa]EKW2598522.1 NAD(P)-dependent alcohol dehydrogenase [Pseudomonas aeruginosa]EME5141369.1 NAD(P)-dependent alcohol dehydrogenase [Pseudomonas aeruginosa]KSM97514.1 NAD(P)-dependent alcohol dehydrogenase [Pseudomonas aeruginosa]
MHAYQLIAGQGVSSLRRIETTLREPGPHEVRVRIRAVSLNYRDLMVAHGNYVQVSGEPVVPVGDGAGDVVAVGSAVTRFRAGDRVINTFFPAWLDGAPSAEKTAQTFGADSDGVLAEEVCVPEAALVTIPAHLDYAEAASMPCAAITAWNALFVTGGLKPGDSVLLLGTGGVSIWALQLAKAAGLRVIITSSSDDKLQRARALGADEIINYRATPEWQEQVLKLTHGHGVNLVAEVGGEGTLAKSIAATAIGGTIAIVGGVTGFAGTPIDPLALIGGARRLVGIFVGSRTMLEDVCRFVAVNQLRPVVDRAFSFDQAPDAYEYLEAGRHFGKVVIHVN